MCIRDRYIFGYVDILNDKLMNLWYINIEYPIESYYIYFKAVTFVWVLIGFVITIFVIYRIARRWIDVYKRQAIT